MTFPPVTIGGRNVQLDPRGWNASERYVGSIIVLISVVVLLIVGISLQVLARESADVPVWVLVGLVVLLLVYEILGVTAGLMRDREDEADRARLLKRETAPVSDPAPRPAWSPPPEAFLPKPPVLEAPPEEPTPPPAPRARGPQILTLKCGECATVFDVQDYGTRPLYHACPGCGAEGVLRGAADPVRAVDPARPIEDLHKKDDWMPPDLPEVKRIKLRCGACKSVFQVEDTGERPLRHRCPSCGKLGEIR